MNEQQIAYRIKQHLNRGLDLDADKLARLKAAREQALVRQRVESRVAVFAWADNVVGKWGGPPSLIARILLPMAVLILGLISINQWRGFPVWAGVEENDGAMVNGGLPLDGYLDKGVDAWLKRSSP